MYVLFVTNPALAAKSNKPLLLLLLLLLKPVRIIHSLVCTTLRHKARVYNFVLPCFNVMSIQSPHCIYSSYSLYQQNHFMYYIVIQICIQLFLV